MSWSFKGVRDWKIDSVVFFWDGSNKIHVEEDSVLKRDARPPDSQILLVNIYLEDDARFLGTGFFLAQDMTTGKPLSTKIKRHSNSRSAGTLTISDYTAIPQASLPQKTWLVDYVKNGGGVPDLDCVRDHNRSWSKLDMALREIRYFRMPHWQFGSNFAVPGVMFPTFRPVAVTPASVRARAVEIALDRTGATLTDLQNTTPDGLAAMAWYHCAYSHCIPYSLEQSPLQTGAVEYFAPPGLRDTGDCEDVSWAICNSCRELWDLEIPNKPQYRALLEIQRLNSHFHPFMVLGAATDASPDQSIGKGKIMAHMYALLIPYETLAQAGLDLARYKPKRRGRQADLPVLLLEGTGTVWPIQLGPEPSVFSGEGKGLSDALVRKYGGAPPARRIIFSPGSKENDYRVAEFYLNVVSGVSPFPDVGMYAFLDKNGRVGPLLHNILERGSREFSLSLIEGTRQTDKKHQKEFEKMHTVLRLHQPTLPRHFTAPVARKHNLEKRAAEFAKIRDDGDAIAAPNRTRFFVSSQDMGTEKEDEFFKRLKRELSGRNATVVITPHNYSGVGSCMVDIFFN